MVSYAGIVAAASEAAPGGVGATPAFGSAGTTTTSTVLAATHSIAHPATVSAGDLLLCLGFGRNNNADSNLAMHASMSGAGWAHLTGSPFVFSIGGRVLLIAWKIAAGTEGGTSIPGGIVGSGGTTSDGFVGVCQAWTAADGFRTANPFESIGTIAEVSATSRTMPTVTPTGTNRRAVAIVTVGAGAQAMASATGESGGDWVEVNDVEAVNAQIQTQSSDQSGGGAISGGTTTTAGGASGFVLGFALVPAGG